MKNVNSVLYSAGDIELLKDNLEVMIEDKKLRGNYFLQIV